MPIHDWKRVSAGVFHDFHSSWIAEIKKTLNSGLLPKGYYAMAEQVAGEIGPDVLTLKSKGMIPGEEARTAKGTATVQEAPPKVSFTAIADEADIYALKRRSLVIRHASDDQVVAFLEIISPGNKNRERALRRFIDKAVSILANGFHLLIIDVHPPGAFDPQGIHGALWAEFQDSPYRLPPGKLLTLAAYSGGAVPKAYVEPMAVGSEFPEMPLFLEEDRYVPVPLEETYTEAYRVTPERWRRALEGAKR